MIVLLYHGDKWIHPCVQSLERQTLSRDLYEIILVDNGGSTPSVKRYEGKVNIQVIHFPQNYGFTGGNNRALVHAQGEFVFLVNQDTVTHVNCLRELLLAFDSNPGAGILAASMRMVSLKDGVDLNGPFDRIAGMYSLSPLGYASYTVLRTEKRVIPVDFVSGNGLGIRRDIIKDIGHYLFDERLGSYTEDLDLTIRLKRTHWKMVVCPRAVIYHYRDESFKGNFLNMLRKFFHISTNRLMVYYWNFETTGFLKKMPALLIGIPLKAARPDGSRRFHLSKLFISFMTLPVVLLFFIIRLGRIFQQND